MSGHTSKHSAKHATDLRQPTVGIGRLPHGFGGVMRRVIRGSVSGFGGVRSQSATSELTNPAAQQLKILQDIYGLMTGPGINVIVKNSDLQARFG
jgi:hypothetical protein